MTKSYVIFAVLALSGGAMLHASTATKSEPQINGAVGSVETNLSNAERLRQELRADPSLSIAAQNIGITPVGNKLSLTGEVYTPTEKNTILLKARNIAGKGYVEDHITIVASRK